MDLHQLREDEQVVIYNYNSKQQYKPTIIFVSSQVLQVKWIGAVAIEGRREKRRARGAYDQRERERERER
jgi:hypothetical protein